MRFLFGGLCVLLALCATPLMAGAQGGMAMPPLAEKSKTTLVIFSSDLCVPCQMIDLQLNAALSLLAPDNRKQLKIVTFDFSNDITKADSAALAGQNGLSDVYNFYAPKAGFIILLNEDVAWDHQTMITAQDRIEDIQTKLIHYIEEQS